MKTARLVSAALLTAAALFVSARPASAAPQLWLVQSPSAKVYLFGTVHLLRDDVQWRTPALENAIAQSQDLYEEIADPMNTANAASAVAKLGIDRQHLLSTKISKADVAALDKAAKLYGFPGESMFEPMQPWLVYMMLAVMPSTHAGYKPASGVDLQIRKEFVASNKPVNGFETIEQQCRLFADMPQAVQVAMLEQALKSIGASSPQVNAMDTIVAAWQSGDDAKLLQALALDHWSPATRTALLTNRNKAWADALSQILKQRGTTFVAVGAAHLEGPDGVPALLQKMGYTVTRVDNPDATPNPSATPTATPAAQPSLTPSPAPQASATPIPRTVTPPAGWVERKMSLQSSTFVSDMLWSKPGGGGGILTGHLQIPGGQVLDLATTDSFFHQGLITVAGKNGVTPSAKVKICSGKQDGTYSKLVFTTSNGMKLKEDVVLAVSDRPYMAQYIRPANVKDDPAALASIMSLCAP